MESRSCWWSDWSYYRWCSKRNTNYLYNISHKNPRQIGPIPHQYKSKRVLVDDNFSDRDDNNNVNDQASNTSPTIGQRFCIDSDTNDLDGSFFLIHFYLCTFFKAMLLLLNLPVNAAVSILQKNWLPTQMNGTRWQLLFQDHLRTLILVV